MNKIETCFSPALFSEFRNDNAIVVISDILRATTSICTAFMNGAKKIIPVSTLEEAKEYKEKGYTVAAERDGIVRDFADFGNSPYNFTRENIEGKEIVYSTTNGTYCINLVSKNYLVLIGSYLNITALSELIETEKRDLLILCAGWKNKFNLEDTLFAGALIQKILENKNFHTICDSSLAAIDLWNIAKDNLTGYIEKTAQRNRLKKNNLDDVIEYCHQQDLTSLIPKLEGKYLVTYHK